MLALHPTLHAVNSFVDDLSTVPRLRPVLDEAMQRLRDEFTSDNSIACGIMMLSEKLDILLSAYESFISFNKLGGHHASVRRCAFVTETLFASGRKLAHLTVTLPGPVSCQLLVRPPASAGGLVKIEQPGYFTKRMEAVFRLAAFAPAEEPRVRRKPTLRNVIVTRDEVHTFLLGLCTAEGVSFELEAGRATLVRQPGAEARLTMRCNLKSQ